MRKSKKKQDPIFSALEGLELEKPLEPLDPEPLSTANQAVIATPPILKAESPQEESERFSAVNLVTDLSDLPNFSFDYISEACSSC